MASSNTLGVNDKDISNTIVRLEIFTEANAWDRSDASMVQGGGEVQRHPYYPREGGGQPDSVGELSSFAAPDGISCQDHFQGMLLKAAYRYAHQRGSGPKSQRHTCVGGV